MDFEFKIEGGKVVMDKEKEFTIRIASQFIPTPNFVKSKFGVGYKVLSVEVDKEIQREIKDVDSALDAIVAIGYRSLARAFHPDLGGDKDTMVILNRAKKELSDLLREVRA